MDYVYIGKLFGTHGLKGEIKLNTNFEYINKVLKEGFNLYIGNNKNKEILESYRYHNKNYLIKFKNINDIEEVKKYVNNKVYVLKSDLELKENEFVIEDYLELNCYFNNNKFGKIIDVIDTGNKNYVFVIKDKKEILIPYNKEFIEKITDKDIYFKNVEGLIDEN